MPDRPSSREPALAAKLTLGLAGLVLAWAVRHKRRQARSAAAPVAIVAPAPPAPARPDGLRSLVPIALVLVAILGAFLAGYAAKREHERKLWAGALTGGDPAKGPRLMLQVGCAGCHEIRGVRGPGGLVGPPLSNVGQRVYLAGRLTNTPANLIGWIAHPRDVDPQTAMPVTGISDADARHVAAYLLALR